MKQFLIIAILTSLFTACTNNNHKRNTWKHFKNEWIDFDYPSYMYVVVERNKISDTIPGLKQGGNIYVEGVNVPFRLRITKSFLFDVFSTPEQWRDAAIEIRNHAQGVDGENEYLGIYDKMDSLIFDNSPAAAGLYAVKEGTDTLAWLQLVVLRKDKNLYYINYIAPISLFDDCQNTADSILNTIQFKDYDI